MPSPVLISLLAGLFSISFKNLGCTPFVCLPALKTAMFWFKTNLAKVPLSSEDTELINEIES